MRVKPTARGAVSPEQRAGPAGLAFAAVPSKPTDAAGEQPDRGRGKQHRRHDAPDPDAAGQARAVSAEPSTAGIGGPAVKRRTWLPATPASAGPARVFVHEAATRAGLDDACAWDLMLATSEAVANAVQHGKAWPNGSILVTTELCARGLRVEVTDCGSFDSTIEPTPLESESGRGLPIIAAVVDLLEVRNRNGRTLVRFERHWATT
jgi:serine/threonine-protein kinase RsbW